MSRDALRAAVAHEEAFVAKLQVEHAESLHRLSALRAELASQEAQSEGRAPVSVASNVAIPQTSADKVRLFRSLFRGREDIYPVRFHPFEARPKDPTCCPGLCLLELLALEARG